MIDDNNSNAWPEFIRLKREDFKDDNVFNNYLNSFRLTKSLNEIIIPVDIASMRFTNQKELHLQELFNILNKGR